MKIDNDGKITILTDKQTAILVASLSDVLIDMYKYGFQLMKNNLSFDKDFKENFKEVAELISILDSNIKQSLQDPNGDYFKIMNYKS